VSLRPEPREPVPEETDRAGPGREDGPVGAASATTTGMVAARESLLCHAAGGLPIPLLRDARRHGQIPRGWALVCGGGESPFSGIACGPWGGSGTTVWPDGTDPRGVWPPARAAPRGHHAVDAALLPCQRQKRPAAGTVMCHGRRIAA
jgi:hypothetical protein